MEKLRYRLYQVTESPVTWESQEVFTALDIYDVRRAVAAGWLLGWARWATTEAGDFLCGLDAKGRDLTVHGWAAQVTKEGAHAAR